MQSLNDAAKKLPSLLLTHCRVAYKWKENPGQAPIVSAVVPQTAQQKGKRLCWSLASCMPLLYIAFITCKGLQSTHSICTGHMAT